MGDAPFTVDAYGPFWPPQVRVVWKDEPRTPRASLDAMIAETWERQSEAARHDGTVLFNAELARYLRHDVRDGILTIDAGPTDYRQFVGTNLFNPDQGEKIGWDLYSSAIGISAVVATADGWLLFGRRSQQVVFHKGCVHTFGGMLEMAERRADGTFDAFGGILRELGEEAGVQPAEVEDILCLGLIRDATIRQPELVFDVRIKKSRTEMSGCLGADEAGSEHAAVVACRDAPEAVLWFIRSHQPVTAVAIGAMCLRGRRAFGEAWYAATLAQLKS